MSPIVTEHLAWHDEGEQTREPLSIQTIDDLRSPLPIQLQLPSRYTLSGLMGLAQDMVYY